MLALEGTETDLINRTQNAIRKEKNSILRLGLEDSMVWKFGGDEIPYHTTIYREPEHVLLRGGSGEQLIDPCPMKFRSR